MNESIEKYNDIINMPHHVSTKYPHIPEETRAAQFAPYAALTGYGDVVKETARMTSERVEIDEDMKSIINRKIQELQKTLDQNPIATFTYFIQDMTKSGGEYVTVRGVVEKIDEYSHIIILQDGTVIPIKEIIDVE